MASGTLNRGRGRAGEFVVWLFGVRVSRLGVWGLNKKHVSQARRELIKQEK